MNAGLRLISLFIIGIACVTGGAQAQELYFPPVGGSTWETMSLSEAGFCQDGVDSLLEFLGTADTKAFLVLKDGKIVIEEYYDSFTADSLWYWASAAKTLTAFLVGKAQEQDLLSIEDPTSDYLGQGWTSLEPGQEQSITVRHQLTMTTGLDDGVPDHFCTLDTCLVYKADAGTRWAYHNGPYTLLDEVIKEATGQNLNLYVHAVLRGPIGMNGLFVPVGYNNVYFSTPRSMARFGLFMLGGGNWDGEVIMEDETYFSEMINTSQDLNPSYGYLWWLNGKERYKLPGLQIDFQGPLCPDAPDDMYAALGKDGQILSIVPGDNFLFVRMGRAPGAGLVSLNIMKDIWAYLNAAKCGSTATETLSGSAVNVFPNPASSRLFFDIPVTVMSAVSMDGHRMTTNVQDNALDVSQWPRGVYYLRCRSVEGAFFVRSVVVQ
jgi:CubicO group peptidase (beta-lactamase class C family)